MQLGHTRDWNTVNNKSSAIYSSGNEFIYSKEALKSGLCDYNDAYILGSDDFIIIDITQESFKNCAPLMNCITKINGKIIDDAESLDLVTPIYNLLEYSSNYSDTEENLWFYSKDEAANINTDIANGNNFKPISCKPTLLENTVADQANGILSDTKTAVLLKYLNNFLRSLEMSLFDWKVEL